MADARIGRRVLARRQILAGYMFVAPWVLGFLFFTAGPMIFSFIASFTNYDVTSRFDLIGLANFRNMLFNDSRFWTALYNTAFYTLFAVPLGITVGLTLAILQNVKVPGVRYFRTIFYLPAVLTGVPVYMLWLWILNPQGGLVNAALGLFGITGPAWLADANWAKPGYILMSSWGACAGSLMYLAALKGIPSQMYEVAEIDGARGLRRFFAITVPLISPVIFFRLVTGISGSLQMFAPALVMSESGAGGPSDSTLFYGLYLWRRAFVELNMGYASAMAWFLLGLVLVLTVIQLRLQHRWVFYEGGEK